MGEARRRRMQARAAGIKMDPPKTEHRRRVEAFILQEDRARMLARMEQVKCESEMVFVEQSVRFMLDVMDQQEKQQERKGALIQTPDEAREEAISQRLRAAREEMPRGHAPVLG